ncbi:SusD/RagB family nutrient-binding outer membrane lipoprotein [Pedobacter gandavensis]|uniref:SusD/RagB family nutrient-binding outer membrane lipoprotein n=1 Tax=Pedobacter TaxID=84567 RepID=UPI001C998A53|nr:MULTISPECIES: SusD/RagB family nutrient-binding outer membrane lipoprotein [Pedobacter]WGQ11936.1 SusD/RagB family nutrient-binding outer membrane lipoprotein [Pedobacter gandavensis]
MKKKQLYILGLIVFASLGQSCKKHMIELNTRPDTLEDVDPKFLFTSTVQDINYNGRDKIINRYTIMSYMQYIVRDGADVDLSGLYWASGAAKGGTPPVASYYEDYYKVVGVGLNRLLAKIEVMPEDQKIRYENLKALSQITDVYQAWRAVDLFGAMPYDQAFQDLKYPNPIYEYDYDLYKKFDAKLKTAATAIKNIPGNQVDMALNDLFYNGDMTKWLKFANTLRIKIAQRYEKRDPANLEAVLLDIQNNFSGQLIGTYEESFGINHTKDWNNNVDDLNQIKTSYNAAYPFVEFLKSTRDPRLAVLVRENQLGTNNPAYNSLVAIATPATLAKLATPEYQQRYYGKHTFPASQSAAYGPTGAGRFQTFATTSNSVNLTYQSLIQGRYFVKNSGFKVDVPDPLLNTNDKLVAGGLLKYKSLFISYAETCFMMAEIAAKKGAAVLGKDAATWYNAGVTASFDQYKRVGTDISVPYATTLDMGDYLTRFPYRGLESIYSQAWVHYLAQPEEAWAMWKRTGYPQSKDFRPGQPTTPGNIGDGTGIAYLENLWNGNENLIRPRRGVLPGSDLNSDNKFKAVADMKAKDPAYGNDINDAKGRIWWDKQ